MVAESDAMVMMDGTLHLSGNLPGGLIGAALGGWWQASRFAHSRSWRSAASEIASCRLTGSRAPRARAVFFSNLARNQTSGEDVMKFSGTGQVLE